MTETEQLRALLEVYGIDDTQYTDAQLELMIQQAKNAVSADVANETTHEDYHRHFAGTVYMTDYYPVDVESLEITVDGEVVVPRRITHDGLVYFDNLMQGELVCTYSQAFDEGDVESTIIPLAMYMIRDKEGGNQSSIKEGDITVSFDTDSPSSTNAQISHLVSSLRAKYNKARVRLI